MLGASWCMRGSSSAKAFDCRLRSSRLPINYRVLLVLHGLLLPSASGDEEASPRWPMKDPTNSRAEEPYADEGVLPLTFNFSHAMPQNPKEMTAGTLPSGVSGLLELLLL